MKRLWWAVGSFAVIGLVVIAGMLVAPKPPIPADIKHKLTFTLLVPASPAARVDRSSVKYDGKLKLLTFTLTVEGINAIVSEQPTPESFSDIPQVFEKVVTQMQEYKKFDVDFGTVHLTRPKDAQGKQAAVLNTKGTLLFAKPDQDLSEDQWHRFMSSLVVVK